MSSLSKILSHFNCMKKKEEVENEHQDQKAGRFSCIKKPSAKTMKIGGFSLLALAVLAAVGVTLAAHFGVLGQGTQHFLNNKILSPIHTVMTAEIPGWTIPTALGGTLAIGGLIYGGYALNERRKANAQSSEQENITVE